MRVAYLVTSFPTISETFILDQITGLLDRGCEVEIFAAQPGPAAAVHPEVVARDLLRLRYLPAMPEKHAHRPLAALRVALQRLPELWGPLGRSLDVFRHGAGAASLRLFFETAAILGRPPFDVVHCHFGPNGVRGLSLREIGAIRGKLVTSFYGYDISEFPRHRTNPYARLFREGELFIAISEVMKARMVELGCPPGRIVVHPLGVDTGLFPVGARAKSGSPLRITTIGRMVPKKGIEYGLRAVAELRRTEPGIRYRIIGDGPLRSAIESLVDELGLRDVVELVGWQARPEVVQTLRETDILLAPSVTSASGDEEGTPVVIMEALASGLPVVSSLHAGIPEVVREGVSGFLAPERDVARLAAALATLAQDAGLRASMGERGRLDILERHDIGRLNDRLMAHYRRVIEGRGCQS